MSEEKKQEEMVSEAPPEEEEKKEVPKKVGKKEKLEKEIEELKLQNEELQKNVDVLKNEYARAYADTENIKRRLQNEFEQKNKYRIQDFAKEIIPVIDNCERALAIEVKDETDENYRKGFEMVKNQLWNALQKEGVEEIEALGQPFDPNWHQAMLAEHQDGVEEGNISIQWSVKNYDSSDEATHLTISENATEGVYTATVTRPDSSTRVYLTATLKYGEEELTEKYTLTLTAKTTAEAAVEMTAEDVEVQYVLDSVDGFKNFVAAEGAAEAVKFHWTYEEVNKLDSTVANYLKYDSTKLSVEQEANKFYKQYTAEPIKGTNYYFLVIKFAEKADTKLWFADDEDYEDATQEEITASDALKATIVEKLKEDLLTDNDITRILFENRTKNGLVINDRFLQAVYEYSYKKFFDTTIAVTDYLPFIKNLFFISPKILNIASVCESNVCFKLVK